jgi:cytochrome c2
VRSKWYLEFPAVIIMIVLGIVVGLNLSLPTCNKPKSNPGADKLSKTDERWLNGKDLFKSNCVACHNVTANGVGPALQGAQARWHAAGAYQGKTGDEWMKIWVRNWHDAVNARYKYAVDMANSRPQEMNIFVGMTDEKIDDIFLYIESPDGLKPATAQQK